MKLQINEYVLGVFISVAVFALVVVVEPRFFPNGLPVDQKWIDLAYVTVFLVGSLACYHWRFHRNPKFWFVLAAYSSLHLLISALYFRDHDGWPIRLWVPPLAVESGVFSYLWQCVLHKSAKPSRFL
jgi:peptidoglycan/LPS O-acetylase OafA/YrhL